MGSRGQGPTAPSGPVWLYKAHLRITQETTRRTPDAGAIGRSWCLLGRPGSIAQEKDAIVYRRWAHYAHSRRLGCILYWRERTQLQPVQSHAKGLPSAMVPHTCILRQH